jgi:hypothetical protein
MAGWLADKLESKGRCPISESLHFQRAQMWKASLWHVGIGNYVPFAWELAMPPEFTAGDSISPLFSIEFCWRGFPRMECVNIINMVGGRPWRDECFAQHLFKGIVDQESSRQDPCAGQVDNRRRNMNGSDSGLKIVFSLGFVRLTISCGSILL